MMNRKLAMTFSEVLITLTIIGVVAAITIPPLKKYTQKNEYVTKLKKAYVTLEQNLDFMAEEKGPISKWNFTNLTIDDFAEYLLIAYKCEGDRKNNCFADSYGTLDGGTGAAPNSTPILLLDGTSLALENCTATTCDIAVDVNALEKPNVYGVDYFTLQLDKEKEKIVPKEGNSDDCLVKDIIEDGWQMNYW